MKDNKQETSIHSFIYNVDSWSQTLSVSGLQGVCSHLAIYDHNFVKNSSVDLHQLPVGILDLTLSAHETLCKYGEVTALFSYM
jgi:hypothetical protein